MTTHARILGTPDTVEPEEGTMLAEVSHAVSIAAEAILQIHRKSMEHLMEVCQAHGDPDLHTLPSAEQLTCAITGNALGFIIAGMTEGAPDEEVKEIRAEMRRGLSVYMNDASLDAMAETAYAIVRDNRRKGMH